jgi:hypothetical protein
MLDDDLPVVWPTGTQLVSADPLLIRLPDGAEVGQGDRVSGSGGYLNPDNVDVDIPSGCLSDRREVAVFSPADRPKVD